MIEASTVLFPHNVVEILELGLKKLDPVPDPYDGGQYLEVIKRPLRATDPAQSVGVFSQMWNPEQDSYEMMGGGSPSPQHPTLQTYTYGIQSFIKDGDEERGLATHSTLETMVRRMLYTYEPLKVALAALKVEWNDGSVEQLKRWGVRTARYFSNEIDGTNLFLATLEFWVETEMRRSV